MGKKLIIKTVAIFQQVTDYPETYPDMTLEEAIASEKQTPWEMGMSWDEVIENAEMLEYRVDVAVEDV